MEVLKVDFGARSFHYIAPQRRGVHNFNSVQHVLSSRHCFSEKRTIDLASNLFSLLFLSVFLFIYSLIFPNFDYTRKYDRPDRNASHPRPNGGERPGRARPGTYEGKAHRGEQVYPTCVQPVQKSVRVLSLTHERFMLTSEINGIGRQNAKANLYATDV